MTRTATAVAWVLLLGAVGCGEDDRVPAAPLDCSFADAYEFKEIFYFSGDSSSWYLYGDGTRGGVPMTVVPDAGPDGGMLLDEAGAPIDAGFTVDDAGVAHVNTDVPIADLAQLELPLRCGNDSRCIKLEAYGHNFWGAGFGEWMHNLASGRADGTGYEGISFWVKSSPGTEKTFLLRVDDGQTIVLNREVTRAASTGYIPECDDPSLPQVKAGDVDVDHDGCLDPEDAPACQDPLLPQAVPPGDQDLNGDGCLGPGDIASGTECRLPPPQELGDPPCYKPGVNRPGTASRVPDSKECGNYFHTYITTTENWQLMLLPWKSLVQWPCPNRLEDGINPADIAGFKIEFVQGTHYEVWIDNIAFYRRRADAGN